ncbi:MAG: DUF1465 family protein [Rhodobiaceae bacterium]|nr:DUF1465 family protein [Caldilineaceae bacterium]MCB1473508.1 DUF1465 family protein [Rhodobiaceae bacterium]MCC0053299.1 DUF1465 family protein [Rhodobiaceae bacterium]
MANTTGSDERIDQVREPISFGRKALSSETFLALFREGMALLEETADYLDGPGREESRELSRVGSLAYAAESMKLTTRLMQMASWLLLHRAVNEGEMTQKQAEREKSKVKLQDPGGAEASAGFDELPEALRLLVERSTRLQQRIQRLDQQIYEDDAAPGAPENPLRDQLDRLSAAFGAVRQGD